MALIAHRCKCSHLDYFHNYQGVCSYGTCRAKCKKPVLDPEPEVIPTFTWDGRQSVSVETIHAPGTKIGSDAHPIVPCDCDRCVEIYSASQ